MSSCSARMTLPQPRPRHSPSGHVFLWNQGLAGRPASLCGCLGMLRGFLPEPIPAERGAARQPGSLYTIREGWSQQGSKDTLSEPESHKILMPLQLSPRCSDTFVK